MNEDYLTKITGLITNTQNHDQVLSILKNISKNITDFINIIENNNSALKIQKIYRGFKVRQNNNMNSSIKSCQEFEMCALNCHAINIQKIFRGFVVRNNNKINISEVTVTKNLQGNILHEIDITVYDNGKSPEIGFVIMNNLKNIKNNHNLKFIRINPGPIGIYVEYNFNVNSKSNIEHVLRDIVININNAKKQLYSLNYDNSITENVSNISINESKNNDININSHLSFPNLNVN